MNWTHLAIAIAFVFVGYFIAKKWPSLIPGFPQAASALGA